MNTRTTGGASEQWNQRTWEDTASEAKDATRSRLGKSLVAGSTSTNIHNFFFFFTRNSYLTLIVCRCSIWYHFKKK